MTHKHKKKHHHHYNKKKSGSTESSSSRSNWVERLDFVDVAEAPNEEETSSSTTIPLTIVSWNILAQSYCNRRSHHHLPKLYMNVVFRPDKRRELLLSCLKRLVMCNDKNNQLDVLCLQEVDMLPEISHAMMEWGYSEMAATPTSKNGGGSGGRIDAVVIFANSSQWKIVEEQVIRLDDLATLGHSSRSSLSGLQQSFLRRNVALLVRLQRITGQTVVVANAHLFWNPIYEYVKLCQTAYLCERIQEFARVDEQEPIIVCGDFNSTPSTSVHEYLTKGVTNAKLTAPWYRGFDEEQQQEEDKEQLQDAFHDMTLQQKTNNSPPKIRYMLDFTLNRFTRWLRILGIDAALETEQEEIERTKFNNHMILFDKCKKERRTLITTSSKLTLRKDCPPGTYLVNARAPLESALVNVLRIHGVILEPANFLSRCVVCNGSIQDVVDEDHKRRVFAASNAPDLSKEVEMVYQCDGCEQGYWWSDNPTSSASRVKGQATRLFELCVRGGIPTCEDLGMFDNVNVDAERKKGLSEDGIELEHLEVLKWLNDETLMNPLSLKSAYALYDDDDNSGEIVGEDLSFTNVTHDFVGLLDYVLFDASVTQTKRLLVPSSFNELNTHDLYNGHLLPSNIWPSDHLAIGAELQLPVAKEEVKEKEETAAVENGEIMLCGTTANGGLPPPPLPTTHAPRCTCGCVPQIRSLFEMAELRKQARKQK